MVEITIRKASIEDLDEITEVEAKCFPPAEAAKMESFEQRLKTFSDRFFVAEDVGRMIGFVNGCITDSRTIYDDLFHHASLHKPDGDYQAIFGLAVIPKYRNKGIAAQLMEHMIEDSRANGRKGVILTCKEHLIHYYAKFGFENLGVSGSQHGGAVWYDMIIDF